MKDWDHIQEQIRTLQTTAADLGGALRRCGEGLSEARPEQLDGLLSDLDALQAHYDACAERLVSADGPPAGLEQRSLAALEQTARTAAAAGLLDRAASLTTPGGDQLDSLAKAQQSARELRDELRQRGGDLPVFVDELLDARHPLAMLLELVCSGDELDDERWTACHDAVATTYGKKLAVAVARRKLVAGPVSTPSHIAHTDRGTADE